MLISRECYLIGEVLYIILKGRRTVERASNASDVESLPSCVVKSHNYVHLQVTVTCMKMSVGEKLASKPYQCAGDEPLPGVVWKPVLCFDSSQWRR